MLQILNICYQFKFNTFYSPQKYIWGEDLAHWQPVKKSTDLVFLNVEFKTYVDGLCFKEKTVT